MEKLYSLPFNCDLAFFESLDWKNVNEVYGAPTDSEVFHGRSRKGMPGPVTTEQVKAVASLCSENNAYFNLVVNSPYYPPAYLQQDSPIDELLMQFVDLPNLKFTVTIPQVIAKISKWFKNPAIKVSKFANIDNVQKLLRWKAFNIECFVIAADVVKNINTVETLCKQGVKSILIVNDPCIAGCPVSNYHFTHSSLHSTDAFTESYSSYCIDYCKGLMVENPYEIMRSSFVRPEETEKYLKIGVDILKIVDRNKPSWWIKRAYEAYLNKKYEGNLLDLFPLFFAETAAEPAKGLYIDNNQINGLVEKQAVACNAEICQHDCFFCNTFVRFL